MRRGQQVDGLRIARLRVEKLNSITQADFANRVGVHWVTMSNIENGKARVSLETLERIAGELGVRREELLADDEDEEAAAMPSTRSLAEDLHRLAALASLLEREPAALDDLLSTKENA